MDRHFIRTAFFDESGTHLDSTVVVVGGYVASEDQWFMFRQEWEDMLHREGIPAIHRVSLENFRGNFARENGWDETRRVRLLEVAQAIIRRWTVAGVGAAVIRRDFDDAMPGVIKRAFGGPYGWLVHDCIVGIGHWANDNKREDLILYAFEDGADGRRQVEAMFESLRNDPTFRDLCRIGGWCFPTKAEAVELQAADFLAYEVYKHMANRIVPDEPIHAIRESAKHLFRPGIDKAH